jgi:hypothetical protein
MVATATGKKTINAQMTTLVTRPVPSHRTSNGARTRIGIACAATRYGESSRSVMRERASM